MSEFPRQESKANVVICIPAFNEEQNIGRIVKRAKAFANQVIVCDDGSGDRTADEARRAGAVVVKHPFNQGYGAAIKTLFSSAKELNADVMVTIDSDGQHDPEQIPTVIKPIIEGDTDVVIGSRFLNERDRKRVPAYRSFGIKAITKLSQLNSHNKLTDAQSGFRAYGKKALAKIDLVEDGMAVSTEILMRAGQRNLMIKEVPITIRYDVEDASTHNPITHGIGVLTTIIKFASIRHPFKFYGIPSIVLLIISGYFMVNALDLFSSTRFISTNMIIISIGTALMGIVLLVTGVILNTMTALLRERIRNV